MAEHFDVVIVGAGISGIGAAHHLQERCPDKRFVVLENQAGFGGTWRTHTYPGVRSDSDLYTFGYRFKPWLGNPIAEGHEILTYLREVVDDGDLERHFRYRHRIDTASWSSTDARWTLRATRTDAEDDDGTGAVVEITAGFLWMCQGYYDHDRPFTPEWDGVDDFAGTIVHPQQWPDDLDYDDKHVVVIGSGATAATLIPNMADRTAHITMLQRSPTYFVARPNVNELAEELRSLDIDPMWIHEIIRRKVLRDQNEIDLASRHFPDLVKDELFKQAREYLGDSVDIDTHFTPRYRPWQQRLAMLPDGDLFKAIAAGKASVVTDTIDRFTPRGIQLDSGDELDADIVVTATGFDLSVLGGISFRIDGEPLVFADTVTWNGAMFTGVPNLLWVFGYFRASWTLRVDLLADFVVRLFAHMDDVGAGVVVPELGDDDMDLLPWVDPEDFNPGYLMRSMHLLPKQGTADPWRHRQNYAEDRESLPAVPLDDGSLRYS